MAVRSLDRRFAGRVIVERLGRGVGSALQTFRRQGSTPRRVCAGMGAIGEVARALRHRGCTHVFGVPGGGPNLELIGELERNGIEFVLAHGESGAAMMASAHGLTTGTLSAVVVTRGPGVSSVVNGAAQATLDRAPLVVITDTVPMSQRERVAHQRFDQRAVLRPVTLRTARIGDDVTAEEMVDLLSCVDGGRSGAVHLDLDAGASTDIDPPRSVDQPMTAAAADVVRVRLEGSEHPVVITGIHAPDNLSGPLESFGAPVLTTYQGAGALAEGHPLLAGMFTNAEPERQLLVDADMVVLIGFDDVEPMPGPWPGTAEVVAIDPVPTSHRFAPVSWAYVGEPADVLPERRPSHSGAREHLRSVRARLSDAARPLGPIELVRSAAEVWPDDGMVTVDAGAHFLAVLPFWPVTRRRQLLISNGLATMGYALPAAIGASLASPDRSVLSLTGDGGLQMMLAELETLQRLQLPVCVTVFNDSELTLIKLKQRDGQGDQRAIRYGASNFAAIAEGFGMLATVVDNAENLHEAFRSALDARAPYLIDVRIDPTEYRHIMAVSRG